MKKTIGMLACALLLPALAVMAQEGDEPEGRGPEGGQPPMEMQEPKEHPMVGTRFMGMLEKRLSLSAEQKTKIEKAIAGSKDGLKKKFDEVRKLHKDMQALEKGLSEKIRATLTDEQKETFDRMEKMARARRGGQGMRRGMEPGGRQGGRRMGPRGGEGGMEPGGRRSPRGGEGGMESGQPMEGGPGEDR